MRVGCYLTRYLSSSKQAPVPSSVLLCHGWLDQWGDGVAGRQPPPRDTLSVCRANALLAGPAYRLGSSLAVMMSLQLDPNESQWGVLAGLHCPPLCARRGATAAAWANATGLDPVTRREHVSRPRALSLSIRAFCLRCVGLPCRPCPRWIWMEGGGSEHGGG